MRYLFLLLAFVVMPGSSFATGVGPKAEQQSDSDWVSLGVIAGCSLAAGFLLGQLLRPLLKSRRAGTSKKSAANSSGKDTDNDLEEQYYRLEAALRSQQAINKELERQLAETKQFLAADRKKETRPVEGDTVAPSEKEDDIAALTLYFLQPARDGKFKESGKVNSAAEALYALTIEANDPAVAILEFVDRPGNVFLAIQHETTWILPACERSNVPSEATRSIRTDIPGKAVLRLGEWEVLEKAKITYV